MGSAAGDAPSGRELEVLKTAARGPTNAEIADELQLAEATAIARASASSDFATPPSP